MVCGAVYISSLIILTRYFDRTNGTVIFASGSPYKPTEFRGKTYEPGQGNNMYIFPGLGLGSILSKAKHVTDSMIDKASIALSSAMTQEEEDSGLVYPRIARIREISAQIAAGVIRKAQKEVCRVDHDLSKPFLMAKVLTCVAYRMLMKIGC